MSFLEAHLHAMEWARENGAMRTVQGHAYPVSERALAAWRARQDEIAREKLRAFLRTPYVRKRQAEAEFA